MLILTRRRGESIQIGEHVFVTVLGWKGNQVHIGVSAPRDVTVDRLEVRSRKRAGRLPPELPPATTG